MSIITVANGNDSGAGSLRAALVSAANGDTINFASGITQIELASTLQITKNVTIEGHVGGGTGAPGVTLDGQGKVGVLNVAAGTTDTLDGLIIQNGNSTATTAGAAAAPWLSSTSAMASSSCSTRSRPRSDDCPNWSRRNLAIRNLSLSFSIRRIRASLRNDHGVGVGEVERS